MKLNVSVSEVMRRDIKYVDFDDSIEKAAGIMKVENIGSVIVRGEKNVKGIVTTSDIVYKHVAENMGAKVSDIMTHDVVSISPEKTINEAAKLLSEKNIEKLLVVDNGNPVGIITANDILKVEPALFEILLERLKIGSRKSSQSDAGEFAQCEVCDNYSDDIEEVNGTYMCGECREE